MERKPAFYKILMELSSHIMLPLGFTAKYGNVLPKTVELRIASGGRKTWKVSVEKRVLEGKVHHFFAEGWAQFWQDTRLKLFELLIFSYVSKSAFDVRAYATSALEKTIYSAPRCQIVLKDFSCYKAHLPKKFTVACDLVGKDKVFLEYVGGHAMPVALNAFKGRVSFGSGWSTFLRANRLSNDITLRTSTKTLFLEFNARKNLIKIQPVQPLFS